MGPLFAESNEVCQKNDGRPPIKLTRVTGGAFAKWLCGASYITFIIPHLHFHISYLHFLFCYKSESLWLIRPSVRAGGATVKGRKRLIRPLFSVYIPSPPPPNPPHPSTHPFVFTPPPIVFLPHPLRSPICSHFFFAPRVRLLWVLCNLITSLSHSVCNPLPSC